MAIQNVGSSLQALDRSQLLRLYEQMETIRKFEERAGKEFAAGKIPGFVQLYAGEEGVAVGVCAHLTDDDFITSHHRGHGHCIAKGVDVREMVAELLGREAGSCRGKGGSMHIADVHKGMLGANGIVGGGFPLAAGAGLTARINGKGRSEEHTSELQSPCNLVCRLLLEKKKKDSKCVQFPVSVLRCYVYHLQVVMSSYISQLVLVLTL